ERATGRIGRAGRRTVQAAVGDGPLHGGADEHRGELDAVAAAAGSTALAVDLVAVVLVVGDPVHVVEHAVVTAEGVVVIVPEALQALLLGGEARPMREDVPPGLGATVVAAAPIGASTIGRDHQAPQG